MKQCPYLGGRVKEYSVGEQGFMSLNNCRQEACQWWIPESKECAVVVQAQKLTQLADMAALLKMFAPKAK